MTSASVFLELQFYTIQEIIHVISGYINKRSVIDSNIYTVFLSNSYLVS